MKFLLFTAFILLSLDTYAQKFQASFSNSGNTLTFSIKPDVTGTIGFSTLEFFIRYPTSTPVISYGNIVENTSNFPEMGNFTVTNESDQGGFHVDHFTYTAPQPTTTPKEYTGGNEYEVFSVSLSGSGTTNLQLVHSPGDEDPFYLAITDHLGSDARPALESTFFYPSTNSSGDPYFYELSNVPLPIDIRKFKALTTPFSIPLLWETANEHNFNGFEVQRSLEGAEFLKIAWIPGKGGQAGASYQYEDKDVRPGITYYYRLKMVDNDGSFEYSPVVSARLDGRGGELKLYPNPASGQVTLDWYAAAAEPFFVDVFSETGSLLLSREFEAQEGVNQLQLDLQDLPPGQYLIRGTSARQTFAGKILHAR